VAIKFRPSYLWSLIPIIVVLGWIFGFYTSVSSRIGNVEKELTASQAEMIVLQNEIDKLTALKRKGEETKSRIDVMSAKIPKRDEIPGFMREIVRAAKMRGLAVEDFTSNLSSLEDRQSSSIINPEIEMVIKGKYLQIGRFLDDLDKNKAFRGILNAHIYYEDKEYPVLTGRFVLQFKARRE
jgi:Tfp pilus assembly protein PilO